MKTNPIRLAAVGLLLMLVAPFVSAELLRGRVVGVVDGDTVDVLSFNNEQVRVRLSGIDAPERRQAFGAVATQRMSDLVMERTVSVEFSKRDRYQRVVGVVRVGEVDAGLAMVRDGLAWHYKKYEREQSDADRVAYAQAESAAKSMRVGLWIDSEPTPPWSWRKAGAQP